MASSLTFVLISIALAAASAAVCNPGETCAYDLGTQGLKFTYGMGENCLLCPKNTDCEYKGTVVGNAHNNLTFVCTCKSQYHPNTTLDVCEDNDECALQTDNCDSNADCFNDVGSFSCRCKLGYTDVDKTKKQGIDCEDKGYDVCKELPDLTCNRNRSTCVDEVGDYHCDCNDGFEHVVREDGTVNNKECADIDECSGNSSCPANSICTNSIGSYKCECMDGFMEANGTCMEIDECESSPCDDTTSECVNLVNDYECDCKSDGFEKTSNDTKSSCKDINECDEHPCGNHTQCVNTVGSYDCPCIYGFMRENGTGECVELDKGLADLEEEIKNMTETNLMRQLNLAYSELVRMNLIWERVKRVCSRKYPELISQIRAKRQFDMSKLAVTDPRWHLNAALTQIKQAEVNIDYLRQVCEIEKLDTVF